jgi:phosphodiesterase/alkaline phosphatase D-like protein
VAWAGRSLRGQYVVITTPEGEWLGDIKPRLEPEPSGDGMRAIAKVPGLEPDTIYCYEVKDGAGATLVGRVGFRTAPEEGLTRFVVIGDSGDATEDQGALAEQMATVDFDLLLHVGDLAYPSAGYAELDEKFFGYYGEFLRHHPVFPVAGNHEYRADGAAPFRGAFDLPNNERWYSFDWGDVHFVAIDTEIEADQQTAWVARDLRYSRAKWKVAFMHRPAYSSGWHGSDSEVRDRFAPIFESTGVKVVFQGHDHHYERTKPQRGVHYFVTGGGGAGTYPVQPTEISAMAQEVIELLYVTADEHELVVHAIDGDGEEFDQLVVPAG